ncbi:hypothetical protein T484DRAFT_1865136 [Baffinella frigidus]|nr:hypothetical protein T484DRAFT_1865136 [Cryptophyta sp. CCMP2293]
MHVKQQAVFAPTRPMPVFLPPQALSTMSQTLTHLLAGQVAQGSLHRAGCSTSAEQRQARRWLVAARCDQWLARCFWLSPSPSTCSRPRIYFDGAGHSFGFMLGVTRHLVATYDLNSAQLFAASAGNLAAILVLLETDPNDTIREHFPDL